MAGLEIAGLGKIAEAIPRESWNAAVILATTTAEKLLAPITETTSGIGRLIRGTFDGLEEWRKIAFTGILLRAAEKVRHREKLRAIENSPRVLIEIIQSGSMELEPEMRELWANLLAREITRGEIHPEIPRILGRLTSQDAKVLREVSELPLPPMRVEGGPSRAVMSYMAWTAAAKAGNNVSDNVLRGAGLIDIRMDTWVVTVLGAAFLEAVSDIS